MSANLLLDSESRRRLFERVFEAVEDYIARIAFAPVTPVMDPEAIRAELAPLDFAAPMDPIAAVDLAVENLWRYQTHTPHPRYYGLFNPAPAIMGVAGDALTAAFNPQIAAWSHSPFAAEVEAHLVRAFGRKFGYEADDADGVFCSGGAEANHTAVLTALAWRFPEAGRNGLRALPAQPVCYASAECHHSFLKAVRLCGLGDAALRAIPADSGLRMNVAALNAQMAADRANGLAPFLLIGTAGTTNAGVVDLLEELAGAARAEGLWYHVDAAWGGAAALSPNLRHLLNGVDAADSITFDAHKWLSAPMGAGVFLTRHRDILNRTFSAPTAYMPRDALGLDVRDPHLHSMQWSRRFIGLKVFLSLLVAGWQGYAAAIDHMTAMGLLLREELSRDGWEIVNTTRLPVVCFADPGGAASEEIVQWVVRSGEAWISTTKLRERVVIRACITNYRTQESDVLALADSLRRARAAALSSTCPK